MPSAKEILVKAIENGTAIPAMPVVMGRLTELCRDPTATARDLAKVIQMDTNLAANILKRVNSSFYGLSSQIKTITHAVVILGFQEIKHMALTFPVAALFREKHNAPGIDLNKLWQWTLTVACIARTLSYYIEHPIPEQVFVSAILGKTGMLIMNKQLGDCYRAAISEKIETERVPFIEKEQFEIGHVQVGWILARQWKFPDELLDAIAYQYNPTPRTGFKREAGLVYAARRLYYAVNHGEDIDLVLESFPSEITQGFNLTADIAQNAVSRAASEYEEIRAMLES